MEHGDAQVSTLRACVGERSSDLQCVPLRTLVARCEDSVERLLQERMEFQSSCEEWLRLLDSMLWTQVEAQSRLLREIGQTGLLQDGQHVQKPEQEEREKRIPDFQQKCWDEKQQQTWRKAPQESPLVQRQESDSRQDEQPESPKTADMASVQWAPGSGQQIKPSPVSPSAPREQSTFSRGSFGSASNQGDAREAWVVPPTPSRQQTSKVGKTTSRRSKDSIQEAGAGALFAEKHLSMTVDLKDERNFLMRSFGGWSSRVWGMQADPLGLTHQRARAMRAAEERRGFQFVQSPYFQLWCFTMILLNAFYIGLNAQIEMEMAIVGQPMPRTFLIVEAIFSGWFLLEVIVRCGAMPWLWFFGPEWRWNMLDTVLVLFSIVDFLSVNVGGNLSEMSSARILRLARFIRLVRLVHAIRIFHSLRVVVLGIIASTKSMYWVFVVVAAINYVFSVFFLQAAVEYVSRYGHEDPSGSQLISLFGDVLSGMTTLFMTITGGIDWGEVLLSLKNTKWMYQAVLLFYVFLMYFAVLNVVIGAVVTATAEISNTDKEILVKSELLRFEKTCKKLKAFFVEADVDQSGDLSWEEFELHLKNDRVKAHFQALELEVSQAHALFKILDADGSDSVGLDEFVQGCMRLKGQAKGLDIKLLMYQNEIAFSRLKKSMAFLTNAVEILEQKVLGNRPGQNIGVRELRKGKSEWGPKSKDNSFSEGNVKLVEFP